MVAAALLLLPCEAKKSPPSHDGMQISELPPKMTDKRAKAVASVEINAPRDVVWNVLTDYGHYASIFPRIESCRITKREGDTLWVESVLKPQMFVKRAQQHTLVDISSKPETLKWKLLDGNFKSVDGIWHLEQTADGKHTHASYTLQAEAGPFIPSPLVSFIMKMVQRENITAVKMASERDEPYAPTPISRKLKAPGLL